MKKYYSIIVLMLFVAFFHSCQRQNKVSTPLPQKPNKYKPVGGGCDGCEFMFEGMPNIINATDTSAGWLEKGQKLLVTGKVYKIDGKTPASNVVIYYWQTDNKGYYSPSKEKNRNFTKHGHIRGWVKSDENGNYAIYTIKPAPYPNESIPSHIHTSIKEPNIENEYYIDEFVFDDDKLLTSEKRKALENRGGSGILRVLLKDDLQIAEHNIILGLHIPNYPVTNKALRNSGLEIGEDNPSFIPYHAFGPDKGTRTCPVCKYGRFHGIVYFVGNNPDWVEIKKWLAFLDQESTKRSKYLKAYFVYGNEKQYAKNKRQKELEKIGKELDLKNIALTFVPSMIDVESEVNLNKINPTVANTFIIYRQRTIIDKFIDLKANKTNFETISSVLDKTRSHYIDLLEPAHD